MAKSRKKKQLKKKPTQERERDPWFNTYQQPVSHRANIALGEVLYAIEQREKRKRKRKPKDKNWLWQAGYCLLANLAYHHLNSSPGNGLVVPRAKSALGKSSRYHRALFTRSFTTLLDNLKSFGYLEQKKGKFSGAPGMSRRTTIKAGTKLLEVIQTHQLTFADFAVSDAEEVIILKRAKRGYWDEGGQIEYDDTEETRRLRAKVQELNSWIEDTDIAFEPSAHDKPVDVRARRLYRYFAKGDFKSGGRLFRGFWQTLPKPARLIGIRIEGERVVELDYSQLNPMLAYARVRGSPPSGDAYSLAGLEQFRDGVKKVFNALLFDDGPRRSFPKGVGGFFPVGTKIGDVVDAIREKHPTLESVLSTGAGFHLMYRESEIMMRVLEQLRHQAIVGLPIFDGVLVKASKAEAAKILMEEEFKNATGLEIEVRLERSLAPHVHQGSP